METREIFMSRDVIFYEHIYPFASNCDVVSTQALDGEYDAARKLVLDTLGLYEEPQDDIGGGGVVG